MEIENTEIDFSKEPYKSMVDSNDPEYSKQAIRVLVSLIGVPNEKGTFRFTQEELNILNQKVFGERKT